LQQKIITFFFTLCYFINTLCFMDFEKQDYCCYCGNEVDPDDLEYNKDEKACHEGCKDLNENCNGNYNIFHGVSCNN